MRQILAKIFDDRSARLQRPIVGLYGLLIAANVFVWLWAIVMFRHQPVQLGTALLAYGFGLRHAVDADHIAAIDNVTRKLMGEGKRPVTVGFFFALGHSAVVVAVAALTAALAVHFDRYKAVGGLISTSVSAAFLFIIAAMNIVILRAVWRTWQDVRAGGAFVDADLDLLLNNRGVLARVFRPAFRLVSASWHMLPLGFLFGLGFDTATEVALLGLSASQASTGGSLWQIMVFPALFAAGMSLIDTTDGILMVRAYDWAYVKPMRKLYYNITITATSVAVALVIGGIETLGLLSGRFSLKGGLWNAIGALNANFNDIGFVVIGIFVLAWAGSVILYRYTGLDDLEVRGGGGLARGPTRG